jgi:putative transposase
MRRAHSDVLVLIHVVFATRHRARCLPRALDGWLHDELRLQASRKGADVIAVGNADDHVHLILAVPPLLALAELVGHLKATTSRAWNKDRPSKRLRWQNGYWARSIDLDSAPRLLDYVEHQREHHRRDQLISAFEQSPTIIA